MEKVQLAICVGSSCHLKGSRDVIEAFRNEIVKRKLQEKVELKAAFCLGDCNHEGVSVKLNDEVISGLTPEKVPSFVDERILPLLG